MDLVSGFGVVVYALAGFALAAGAAIVLARRPQPHRLRSRFGRGAEAPTTHDHDSHPAMRRTE